MNKKLALEWLKISYHDLQSAHILFNASHFTDSIAADLQQSIEKLLKAILSAKGKRVIKTHDLTELYYECDGFIELNEIELDLLDVATIWYKTKRYPNPSYSLPNTKEIESLLGFTDMLFENIVCLLEIDMQEIIG